MLLFEAAVRSRAGRNRQLESGMRDAGCTRRGDGRRCRRRTLLAGILMAPAAVEFVAIMGPSGSGKSIAMNIVGCLDTPSAGQYLFKGAHVESLSRDQRARLPLLFLSFVFQGLNLLARTSAQEKVELPLLYCGDSAGGAARDLRRHPGPDWPGCAIARQEVLLRRRC